jgi:hypothetical protein
MRRATRATAAAALAGIVVGCAPGPTRPITELTPAEWSEDLRFVVERLEREHPALFAYHDVEPERFRQEVADVERAITTAPAHEIALRLDRLVAMVGDGHTSLDAVQAGAELARYPLTLGYFAGELRVYAAPREHVDLLGAEVVAIDGTPVHEALDKISTLVSRDNPQELLWLGPRYLVSAEALVFVGITGSAERATYELRLDGSEREFVATAWALDRFSAAELMSAAEAAGAPTPLYLTRTDERYWLEPLEEEGALYFKWNRIDDAPGGPSLGRFYDTLFDLIDARGITRLIVDLRHNNGGNFDKARRFLDELARRPALARRGGVYVLTSPQTFSAATYVAARLRFEIGATIVGEVSRANPNFTYNSESVTLPRSGLVLEYTDRVHEPVPFPDLHERRYLPVDLPVERTFADYLAGRDPVLERALAGRLPE